MKNKSLGTLFQCFDAIARRSNIKDGDWALAAFGKQCAQSRISEMRRLRRKISPTTTTFSELAATDLAAKTIGRQITPKKIILLFEGLKKLIGSEEVERKVRELLKRNLSLKEKSCLLILLIDNKKQAEAYKALELLATESACPTN